MDSGATSQEHWRSRARASRSRWQARTAVIAGVVFTALTFLVGAHVTQPVDDHAAQWFRPHDEWGRTQALLMPIIDGLQPVRAFVLLALLSLGASLRRSSWRPVGCAAILAFAATCITEVVKFALNRPDPHTHMSGVGGSYPSGHVVALLVCLGGAFLVLSGGRTRWWHWTLAGLCWAAMSAALLFTAAHWLSDVVGGTLLAVAVLAGATALPFGPPTTTRDGILGRD